MKLMMRLHQPLSEINNMSFLKVFEYLELIKEIEQEEIRFQRQAAQQYST